MRGEKEVSWEYNIPLLTNVYILRDTVGVLAVAVGIFTAFFAAITGFQELQSTLTLAAGLFGFMLICYLIACVILGNSLDVTFTVDDRGVSYAAGSKTKKANRAALFAGIVLGSAATAGTGALATSQEEHSYPWREIERIQLDEGRRVIILRNNWRTVLRLYCTADAYGRAAEIIRDKAGDKIA